MKNSTLLVVGGIAGLAAFLLLRRSGGGKATERVGAGTAAGGTAAGGGFGREGMFGGFPSGPAGDNPLIKAAQVQNADSPATPAAPTMGGFGELVSGTTVMGRLRIAPPTGVTTMTMRVPTITTIAQDTERTGPRPASQPAGAFVLR